MLQRGRKSLQAVRVVPGERPPPPSNLTEREGEVWTNVINSLPADYFNSAELYLLAAYCREWCRYEGATQAVTDAVKEANGDSTAEVVATLRALWDREEVALKNFMSLATRMRLTQQSRYDTKKAATAANRGGEKPWRKHEAA